MNQTFGKRFSELRKKHHYTQEDIANKLNITPQAVSKWENDLSAPDISLLKEIAGIFNISIDELLGNEENTVRVVEEPLRKDIKSMLLKIKIVSEDGDKVNINLPLAVIIACLESGIDISEMKVNKALESVDFSKLIALIEQGVVGKLIDIESAEGDTVSIYVE